MHPPYGNDQLKRPLNNAPCAARFPGPYMGLINGLVNKFPQVELKKIGDDDSNAANNIEPATDAGDLLSLPVVFSFGIVNVEIQ